MAHRLHVNARTQMHTHTHAQTLACTHKHVHARTHKSTHARVEHLAILTVGVAPTQMGREPLGQAFKACLHQLRCACWPGMHTVASRSQSRIDMGHIWISLRSQQGRQEPTTSSQLHSISLRSVEVWTWGMTGSFTLKGRTWKHIRVKMINLLTLW